MILIRKAYRGHDIDIRSEREGRLTDATRQAQVWLDGEVLGVPARVRGGQDLDHLQDDARSRIDALHA